MRCLFIILFLSIGLMVQAQERCSISGKVTDKDIGVALSRVNVKVVGSDKGTYTGAGGKFSLRVPCDEELTLEFSTINYGTVTRKFSADQVRNWPDGFELKMEFKVYEIEGIEIFDQPDTVYADEEYHVADFAFLPDGGMLLLTYGKEKRWKRQEMKDETIYDDCKLILLDSLDNSIDSYLVHQTCFGFYVDHMDEVFLRTTEKQYYVSLENEEIDLLRVDEEDFNSYVKPVMDSIGDFLYVSSYNPSFPAFEYYGINKKDSSFHHLHYVVDEPLMELFRSEYKYLNTRGKLEAFRYEVQHGIDKEIVAAYMSGFASTQYYEPLYAPLLLWKDTLMIFDHYHDKLFKYNKFNEVIDSVAISYHRDVKRREWQKKLTLDQETGEVFGVFLRAGFHFLRTIDTSTGNAEGCFKLHHRYAESIKVRDGWAYYVYRPFESSQKKFLYKEAVKNNAMYGDLKKS